MTLATRASTIVVSSLSFAQRSEDRSMRRLLILSLLAAPVLARADVVMPPPTDCPPGQEGVTSHGGPHCEIVPPKDCPPGWTGEYGGTCALQVCAGTCDGGMRCAPTSICFTPRVKEWEYGAAPAPARDVLAAPPRRLDPPVTVWEPTNVCDGSVPCAAPAECRPSTVCLPEGVAAAPAIVPGADGRLLPGAAARTPPTPTPAHHGGCAGCAIPGGPASAGGGVLVLLAGLALLAWRRR
jgi:hypothetical protein